MFPTAPSRVLRAAIENTLRTTHSGFPADE